VADAADGQEVQDALYSVSGSRTVPQVFVDGKYIGGSDGTCVAWML
jgi:glutaredoxin 3